MASSPGPVNGLFTMNGSTAEFVRLSNAGPASTAPADLVRTGGRGVVTHRATGPRPVSPARCTNSSAAHGPWGRWNAKPAPVSRPGRTRRLVRSSSASEHRANAPTSAIHPVAGRPTGTPHTERGARMNARCGRGRGAARFTGPVRSSRPTRNSTALHRAHEVVFVDPRHVLRATRDRATEAQAGQPGRDGEDSAGVRARHHRGARGDLAGGRRPGLSPWRRPCGARPGTAGRHSGRSSHVTWTTHP